MRWYAEGLGDVPERVSALKRDVIFEIDTVGQFIDSRITKTGVDTDRIETAPLHAEFKRWYEQEHNKPTGMSIQALTTDLKRKQWFFKTVKGTRSWCGVCYK